MTFPDWVEKLDKIAFIIIHRDADYKFLDSFFLLMRNALTWIPLYCYLLYFIIRQKQKPALLFIALSIVTIVICDQVSAGFLKPLFERPRPCFDSELQPVLRNIIECGGLYSFPSSHAANHFGLASFWYWSVFSTTGKRWKWLWLWAFLIGYAQVYVGKHFPLDVAGGSLLGIIIGSSMAKLFENWPNLSRYFKNIVFPFRSIES